MSWDIVVFNLSKTVKSIDEIDELILVNIGTGLEFYQTMKGQFPNAALKDTWCEIDTDDCCLEIYVGNPEESVSNTITHLYGEAAIYILVEICKRNNWQAFDTSLGCMLNLDKPEENGHLNHITYVKQIMEN